LQTPAGNRATAQFIQDVRGVEDRDVESAAPGPVLVEDSVMDAAPGQMRRSEFLELLHAEVCRTAEDALRGTMFAAAGCPWIDHWFAYYGERDAWQIERAIRKYAPEAAHTATAAALIPAVAGRVRKSIQAWISGATVPAAAGLRPGAEPSEPSPGLFFKTENGGPGPARAAAGPQRVLSQLGRGQPLGSGVRSQMESAFGQSFADVRVHTDSRAGGLSSQFHARAFTIGSDIAFASGQYRPGTPVGDALIAHELAHVVQQSGSAAVPQHKGEAGEADVMSQTGGAGHGALEEDADRSAVGAVVSLWRGARGLFGELGQNALPRLRSGLQLQRCVAAPVAVGLYIVLRPNVANAPGPRSKTYKSVSGLQVAAEGVALFGVPGAAGIALKEAGYSIVTIGGVTGAMGSVGYRGVQDVAAGEFSGIQAYVFDATTGALIGVVIGGVFTKVSGSKPTGTGEPSELYHHLKRSETVDKILESEAVWARAEGRVYATTMAELTGGAKMRMGLMPWQKLHGRVRFEGQAAGMFEPHPVEGFWSGGKRALGQWVSKRPGYDIKFDPLAAEQIVIIEDEKLFQRTLNISQAEWAKQSTGRFLWSHTRLWSRRAFEWGIPAVLAGAGLSSRSEEDARRSVFSPWSLEPGSEPGIGYGLQSLLDVPAGPGMPGTFGGLPQAPIIYVVPTSQVGGAGAIYLPKQSDIPVVMPNRPAASALLSAPEPGAGTPGEVRLYVKKGESAPVPQWGSSQQNAWIIVNEDLPPGSLTGTISPSRVPALTLDEEGRLVESQ
jgi:hypothetical protein